MKISAIGTGKPVARQSAARYRPRNYLATGVKFGGSQGAALNEAIGDREIARAKAARLQSDISFEIRRRMEIEDMPMAKLAGLMETSYDHLGKVLRGQVIMTLEDRELAYTILERYKGGREERERRSALQRKARAR